MIIRWSILLVLLLVAGCAEPTPIGLGEAPLLTSPPSSTPVSLLTPVPIGTAPTRIGTPTESFSSRDGTRRATQEECVERLRQFYSPRDWENLLVDGGSAGPVHLGELACREDQDSQQLPQGIRLMMNRIDALQAQRQIQAMEAEIQNLKEEIERLDR